MSPAEFDEVLEEVVAEVKRILGRKADEYATDDRLHNFKVAATLQNRIPRQALGGMLAKHTVSVFDMINSGETYSMAQWDEKIIDHINYLVLLRAIVCEDLSQ